MMRRNRNELKIKPESRREREFFLKYPTERHGLAGKERQMRIKDREKADRE